MLLLPLLLAALASPAPPDSGEIYLGRRNQLEVRIPRFEAEIVLDGVLSDSVWRRAALLTGFSQFTPNDGMPAVDSTEVLVWYGPNAIYFGIRAYEPHGSVHATLADRDRIFADDNIQILLGTFNDGRQATVFVVNPLGVQADGTLVETGRATGGGMGGGIVGAREPTDLSPDFVFQSNGRLTPYGYEVEVRIPFKSLRYQPAREQAWSLNIIRQVQHSGFEDTWTPARRASASFLGQSGTLTGLHDLHRGLVLDLNPELTARLDGSPGTGGAWDYEAGNPDIGGNLRWGVTNNLTLNGTANPDFSQVESDAGQFMFDPRQALFFPEKRPFFLDGIEQFNTPNNLVYTRRVVQPVAAVKLTGKAVGTDIGYLGAVDDREVSRNGLEHPLFNILRIQRDIGAGSRAGLVYTDRIDGDDYNRVLGVDGRLVFGRIYSAQIQVAGSRTRTAGTTADAPLWMARFIRSGRTFGMRYYFFGVDDDFRAQSGFLGRVGVARVNLTHSLTGRGRAGALLEQITGDVQLDGTWKYEDFIHGREAQDKKLHFNGNALLRGGWNVGASVLIETFGYDPDIYTGYALEAPAPGGGLDTIPFTGTPRIPNLDWVVSFGTPSFKHFSASAFALVGNDENFFEWASGRIIILNAGINWRPTDQLRVNFNYQHQQVNRRTDGSRVDVQKLPRVKLEYQLSRPLFIRFVGEYFSQQTDSLRDDSRTGYPILIFNPGAGDYVRTTPADRSRFRGDLLVAFRPTPGTVLFAGYGSTLQEPNPFNQARLRRTSDGFFIKMSYLFRV